MIPRWFERLCVLGLLLLAAWLRLYNLPHLPLGFSDEELVIMTCDNPRRLVSGRKTLTTP